MTHDSVTCKVRVLFDDVVRDLDREPESFERERVADFLVCEREDDPPVALHPSERAREREVATVFLPFADLARAEIGDEDDADGFPGPREVNGLAPGFLAAIVKLDVCVIADRLDDGEAGAERDGRGRERLRFGHFAGFAGFAFRDHRLLGSRRCGLFALEDVADDAEDAGHLERGVFFLHPSDDAPPAFIVWGERLDGDGARETFRYCNVLAEFAHGLGIGGLEFCSNFSHVRMIPERKKTEDDFF